MSNTPHLGLPLIAAAQAQKHVTHNEAIALVDALVHLSVKEQNRTAPPGLPQEGERYLVGDDASGAFAAHAGEIALFDLGAWRFLVPQPGWCAYVEAQDRLVVYDGDAWRDLGRYSRDLENLDRLGVGTSADALNRFAAKLNAALFTALAEEEGGTGDMRFVLNKETSADVLSQLYQRGYSGRAETGLIGDDDFRIRVSPDGAAWRDAMLVDRNSAEVVFPFGARGAGGHGNLLINAEFTVNQRVFLGGGVPQGLYTFDRWKAGPGGCSVSRAGDGAVSLTGGLVQIIEKPGLAGETVTVSVENPSAAVSVAIEGATATIVAGAGRRSATLSVPAAATGDVAVTFSGTGVTFARPMLTRGACVEPFTRLAPGLMLMLCQRFYAKTFAPATAPGYAAGMAGSLVSHAPTANAIVPVRWQFPVPMRAVPAITYYNPSAPNAAWSSGGSSAQTVTGSATSDSVRIGTTTIPTITAGAVTAIHAVADAEL
jgi:hypothetical protein